MIHRPIPHGIFHIALKTGNLELTRSFWLNVIGLSEEVRPDFGFPGAWFGLPQPGGQTLIHVLAGGPALGSCHSASLGTAAIDHISISCTGLEAYRRRFEECGLEWRESIVPGTSLSQLFVYDPNGILLELTFNGRVEGATVPGHMDGREYLPGVSFFKSDEYPKSLAVEC